MNTIKISLGTNKYDSYPKDQELNEQQLTELLTTFPDSVTEKGKGQYMVAGHFNGKKRKTEHLQQRTLITLDVDYYDKDLTSLEHDFNAKFNHLWHIVYSTSSHTLEKPRIRIILLLSREVTPDEYRNVAKNFIATLGDFARHIEIQSSSIPNNAMFLPIRTNAAYQPWTKIGKGDVIDVDKFNTPIEKPKPIKKVSLTDNEVKACLAKYDPTVCEYQEWLRVGMALHHQYSGDEKGLNIWSDWSLKDKNIEEKDRYKEKEVDEVCAYKWSTFSDGNHRAIGFSTIANKIKRENCDSMDDCNNIPSESWIYISGEQSTPVMCIENFQVLLDYYNIEIFFDVISKEVAVKFNGNYEYNGNSASTRIKSLCLRNRFQIKLVDSFISLIADRNEANPWAEWVRSEPWDGIDRFQAFCETVKVDEDKIELRNLYLRTWMLQLMHMTCLNDGLFPKMSRYVLVFQSTKQEVGKTTWFKNLVPHDKMNFVAEGAHLDTNNSMSLKECISKVMVELGEISSTFKKSDIDSLKNFITRSVDTLNIKYQAHHMKSRRRTVFFANANETNFLHDKTGNSRFLALEVKSCNAFHGINHQQLYAQMLVLAEATPSFELTKEQSVMRDESNKTYESISVIKEKFEEAYDIENEDKSSYEIATATKALEILGFQVTNMKHYQNELAKILDSAGYERSNNPRKKGWYLPPIRTSYLICKDSTY
jgi:hypothetical protein